ncbi:MAG: short-chain dehydrogenase [Sphingobacteriales bacterium]|nr:short-chain dehydrogenase [Sphingobacteriales bacterium]
MTNDQIEKYIDTKVKRENPVNIHFKDRQPVSGIFIQLADFRELKSKNLWRFVSSRNIEEWNKTHDHNLSRIFNGISFTRISDEK